MRSKILKKILSILMTAILVVLPLFALTASAAENKAYPIIDVPGFMSLRSRLYEDASDPSSPQIWPPSKDSILNVVKNCLPALAELSVTKNWDKFADVFIPEAMKVLGPVCLDERGENSNSSGPRETFPTKEEIEKNGYATFSYDWRVDPLETAGKLDKFIDYVLDVTGAEKVNIVAHSLGGAITLTYSTLFGNSKVNTYVFHSTAAFGITYAGELLSGNMNLTADSLRCFLNCVLQASYRQEIVRGVADMLASWGLLDFVAARGNDIISNLLPRAIPEAVMPMFGRWLTIWAMCPESYYEDAVAYEFGEVMEDNEDTDALRQKVENFNSIVREHREETFRKMDEESRIGVIAKYGYSSLPMTPGWNVNSDGNIDAAFASFGATVAPYTETLSPDYIKNITPEYISPDKTVDASTALFPDRTWYLKEMKHSQYLPEMIELINTIAASEKEFTVYDDPAFPRFMRYDRINESLVPDTEKNRPFPDCFELFEMFWNFFYEISLKIKAFFHS